MERDSNAGMIGWLLAGIALGGVGAVLLATDAGSRTRRRLVESTEDGRKSILESGQDLFTKGRELFEQGREIADDLAVVFEKSRKIAEKTVEDKY